MTYIVIVYTSSLFAQYECQIKYQTLVSILSLTSEEHETLATI